MWNVKVNNILTGKSFVSNFKTEAQANAWVSNQEKMGSWGKGSRQAVRGKETFDESLVLSEFQDTDIDGSTRTIVSLKSEYEVSGPTLVDGSGSTLEDRELRLKNAKEKAQLFKVFKDFGETVELFFTALINERNYTQAQKDAVQADSDIIAVLAELKFGRIAKAKGMIDNKSADESLFYAADLAEVSKIMEDFLSDYVQS